MMRHIIAPYNKNLCVIFSNHEKLVINLPSNVTKLCILEFRDFQTSRICNKIYYKNQILHHILRKRQIMSPGQSKLNFGVFHRSPTENGYTKHGV